MATWATVDDVVRITGREPTQENLALAQSIIEDFAGTEAELDDGTISRRNGGYLTKAVAYQAVWLDSHPDALDAMDVTGVSQDGLSATYKTDTAAFMAPLANRCLNRLSWKTGGIRIGPKRRRLGVPDDHGDRDSAVRDDQFDWAPLTSSGRQRGPLGERYGQVWR